MFQFGSRQVITSAIRMKSQNCACFTSQSASIQRAHAQGLQVFLFSKEENILPPAGLFSYAPNPAPAAVQTAVPLAQQMEAASPRGLRFYLRL